MSILLFIISRNLEMGGGEGGVQGVNKKYELIFLYFHILIFGLVEGGGRGVLGKRTNPTYILLVLTFWVTNSPDGDPTLGGPVGVLTWVLRNWVWTSPPRSSPPVAPGSLGSLGSLD